MGAKEIKTFILNQMDRDKVLEHLTAFGWEFMEVIEAKKYDAYLPKQGGLFFYMEVKPPFLLMTMTRDYNIKNLDKLKKLEQEYYSIQWPSKPGFFGNKRKFEREFNQCVITVNELVERGRHHLHEDD